MRAIKLFWVEIEGANLCPVGEFVMRYAATYIKARADGSENDADPWVHTITVIEDNRLASFELTKA